MSDIVTLVGELTAVRGQRDALMVEIERLKQQIESRDFLLEERRIKIEQLSQRTVEMESEIERLQGNNEKLLLDNCELRNEIERLRKELAEKDDYIKTLSRPIGAHSYE